jgi:pentatricopeptide repeat protein
MYIYVYINIYKYICIYVYAGKSGDIENMIRMYGDMVKMDMTVDHRTLNCIVNTYAKIGTYV